MIYDVKDTFGKYFEDYIKGDIYKHWPGKTITNSDNNLFCLLTMNHHPLHIDKKYYSLMPLEVMENFEKITGVKRLTTGTASILWAVENFEKVLIHGFDFFIDSKSHYNDNFINKWLI